MAAFLERDKDTGRWWLTFPSKPDPETIAKLKADGWRWGSYRKAWFNASRFAKVPEGIAYEEGGLVEYAAERAERLEERAEKAEARSEAAYARSNAAVAGIEPGQPILVGHHSERHHRAAIERAQAAMTKACAESRKAERLTAAAEGSAHAQAQRHDPGAIARRIEKMAKDEAVLARRTGESESLRRYYADVQKLPAAEVEAKVQAALAEYARRLAILRDDLARARAELEAAGGIPADHLTVEVDDVVRVKGFVARVVKVNRKTLSCADYICGQFENPRWPLKWEKSFLREVIGRYCPACEGGARRGCTSCGGRGYTVTAPPEPASEVA